MVLHENRLRSNPLFIGTVSTTITAGGPTHRYYLYQEDVHTDLRYDACAIVMTKSSLLLYWYVRVSNKIKVLQCSESLSITKKNHPADHSGNHSITNTITIIIYNQDSIHFPHSSIQTSHLSPYFKTTPHSFLLTRFLALSLLLLLRSLNLSV